MTRVEQERFGPIDFDWFHREHLPALLQQQRAVFSDSDAKVVRPLAFQLSDGRSYTYVPDGTTFSVQPGTAAADTIVELSPEAWTAFAWELKTCSRSSTPSSWSSARAASARWPAGSHRCVWP